MTVPIDRSRCGLKVDVCETCWSVRGCGEAERHKNTAMSRFPLLLLATSCLAVVAYIPPENHRHEQLSAMHAAFSRFGAAGPGKMLDRQDLPDFLRFVVGAMNSPSIPPDKVVERSTELTHRLVSHLPEGASQFSLEDILRGAEKIIDYPTPTAEEAASERGRLGSKQLRKLRKNLERNRLTMPLFDTKGWVKDFEKALKIQWEIYANGLSPMHIVVARSDRLYGTEAFIGPGAGEKS